MRLVWLFGHELGNRGRDWVFKCEKIAEEGEMVVSLDSKLRKGLDSICQ